jgi:hypothetical protein
MTPMEILADEIKQAEQRYQEHDNLPALMYLKGLEMAQAIMRGEIE